MLALAVASPAFADWPYGVGIDDGNGYIGALTAAINGTAITSAACDATPLTYGGNAPGSGTFTFTADWSKDECSITLDKNNASATSPSPATLYTRYSDGAFVDSARSHQMEVQSGNTPPDYGITPPVGQDITITWNNTNGLSSTQAALVTVATAGTPSSATPLPFLGFYQNQSGTGDPYITNAGYITNDGDTAAKDVKKDANGNCVNPTWYGKWDCVNYSNPVLSLPGYKFEGWYSNSGGTGTKDEGGCTDVSKELFAKWSKENYTVTYNCGTGATFENGLTWTHSTGKDSVTYDETVYNFRSPSICYKEGSEPTGWTCTLENSNASLPTGVTIPWTTAQTWKIASSVTCTANWEGLHNLTYNCDNLDPTITSAHNQGTDGNGTNPEGASYIAGSTISVLNKNDGGCIAPTGKHFKKWNCDNFAGCGDDDICEVNSAPNADIECTAQWDANTIDLRWKKDANTLITTTQCVYGQGAGDSGGIGKSGGAIPVPTKTGYTFNGWIVTECTDCD